MTAARVFAETLGCPLRTRDTVLCDTPLSRAMSLLVNMAFSLVMVTTQILASKPAQHSVPRCLMAYVFKKRREKGLAEFLSGAIFVKDLSLVGGFSEGRLVHRHRARSLGPSMLLLSSNQSETGIERC